MKKQGGLLKGDKGFTLVEVIASMIVASIFLTVLTVFTGGQLKTTLQSVATAQSGMSLGMIMEDVYMNYEYIKSQGDGNWCPDLVTYVGSNYSDYVVQSGTGYISFSNAGNVRGEVAGTDVWKVTLTDGVQSIVCIFPNR